MNSIAVLILIIIIFGMLIACCRYCYKVGYNTAMLENEVKTKKEIENAIETVSDTNNMSDSELDDKLQDIAKLQQQGHT